MAKGMRKRRWIRTCSAAYSSHRAPTPIRTTSPSAGCSSTARPSKALSVAETGDATGKAMLRTGITFAGRGIGRMFRYRASIALLVTGTLLIDASAADGFHLQILSPIYMKEKAGVQAGGVLQRSELSRRPTGVLADKRKLSPSLQARANDSPLLSTTSEVSHCL
ncbi:hypothetical protein SAY86_001139 [Trapa natans]|uniref:Uncharacterized protein n=1 Tax=Trapa natans TaxID=22666 RepID=A0AAN7RM44_TRANT|nr:hypothetical protein SAY86_001139 [Trapa natans]